jgi:PAS domain S-box-containing protein
MFDENEDLVKAFLESIPAAIFVHNTDDIVIFANTKAGKLLGLKEKHLVGQTAQYPSFRFVRRDGTVLPLDEYPATKVLRTKRPIENYLAGVGSLDQETTTWVVVSANPVFDTKGQIKNVVVGLTPFTRSKKVKEALNDSQSQYRQLYNLMRLATDNVPDLVWAKDMQNRFLFSNQAICDKLLMCENPQEVLGKTDLFFAQRERDAGYEHTFGEICCDSDQVTKQCREPGRFLEDGLVRNKYLVLDVHKAPLWDDTGQLIGTVGCGRDVTKEIKIENALKESEARYRGLFEESSDAVIICQSDRVIDANHKICQMLGYSKKALLQMSLGDIYDRDDEPVSQSPKNGPKQHQAIVYETSWRCADGNMIPVEVSSSVVDTEKQIVQQIARDIAARRQAEKGLQKAHQQLEKRVDAGTAELVATNKMLRREIEERRRTEKALKDAYQELQSTQVQLIQTAKLASIGELTAGIAHQLNQPLFVIRANVQMVQDAFKKKSVDVDRMIRQTKLLEKNTGKMMKTIDHLRVFSRQAKMRFAAVEINTVIEDALLMIKEQLRIKGIVVKKQLVPSPPAVNGDAHQLEQVIINLLANARDAIEAEREKKGLPPNMPLKPEGTIEIVSKVENGTQPAIVVLVRDSGGGIEESDLGKIFDPFFTTKEQGKGTGLGLSISYGIIKDHQGEIEVVETGPSGTTFGVKLALLQ